MSEGFRLPRPRDLLLATYVAFGLSGTGQAGRPPASVDETQIAERQRLSKEHAELVQKFSSEFRAFLDALSDSREKLPGKEIIRMVAHKEAREFVIRFVHAFAMNRIQKAESGVAALADQSSFKDAFRKHTQSNLDEITRKLHQETFDALLPAISKAAAAWLQAHAKEKSK